jgi:hypothetical protein
MEKKYTYDLQIVFDGTGDDMHVMGYKSYNKDIALVKREVLSEIVVHAHPKEDN